MRRFTTTVCAALTTSLAAVSTLRAILIDADTGYVRDTVHESSDVDAGKETPTDRSAVDAAGQVVLALIQDAKYDKAKALCEDLRREHPGVFQPHLYLGKIAMLQGDPAGAVAHLTDALACTSEEVEIHALMGRSLGQLGRLDLAVRHVEKAIELNPGSPVLHNNLGITLAQQGKLEEAIAQFQRALELGSKAPGTHLNLGRAYFFQGKLDRAVEHYEASLALDPRQPEAGNLLGQALAQQGDFAGAVAQLNRALELRPDWAAALNNLAWLKATSADAEIRQPKEAISLARRACGLTDPAEPRYLVTLAAAHAAAADFPQAIRTAQEALERADATGQADKAARIRRHLELYQAGLPYRSAPQPSAPEQIEQE